MSRAAVKRFGQCWPVEAGYVCISGYFGGRLRLGLVSVYLRQYFADFQSDFGDDHRRIGSFLSLFTNSEVRKLGSATKYPKFMSPLSEVGAVGAGPDNPFDS